MDQQTLSQVLGWIPPALQGAAVLALVWVIKLAGRVDQHAIDINRIEDEAKEHTTAIWAKMEAVQIQLTSVLQGIARLEGKLDRDLNNNIRP